MLKQQHQLFVGLLVAADAAVITAASVGAWLVRRSAASAAAVDSTLSQVRVSTPWPVSGADLVRQTLLLLTVPILIVCLRSMGLYLPRRDRTLFNEALQIAKACMLGVGGVLAGLYLLDVSAFREGVETGRVFGFTLDAGRIQLVALTLMLPLGLIVHRTASRLGLRMLRRRGWNLRHVAVIGVGRLGQIVATTLERNNWTGIKVSYFVSHQDSARRTSCLGRPVLGGLSDLEQLMTTKKPDAVYLALPGTHAAQVPDILATLDKFPVDVRIVPDVSPRYVPQSMSVSELDGMPILSYRESPTTGLGGVSKRALDIVGALAALVIFGPVMGLVAIAVRLDGAGPVIFKQRRVSLGGQVFDIYKFRTMRQAEQEARAGQSASGSHAPAHARHRPHPAWTTRDDPRITRIGRILRRTSLDELPQLFNVLLGDMSLVGPRPERPELIERFREDWRGYMLRQHVKAGMTGWAQINGHRGYSSLRKRLQYDLFYVKNWSISFDLKILWLTVFRGFVHKNAH